MQWTVLIRLELQRQRTGPEGRGREGRATHESTRFRQHRLAERGRRFRQHRLAERGQPDEAVGNPGLGTTAA